MGYGYTSPAAKEAAHERARGRCEWCGKPGNRRNWELHVHHLTYERRGHENLDDLVVVCLSCHEKVHRYRFKFKTREQQQRRREERRRRLAKKAKRKGKLWRMSEKNQRKLLSKMMKRQAKKIDKRHNRSRSENFIA